MVKSHLPARPHRMLPHNLSNREQWLSIFGGLVVGLHGLARGPGKRPFQRLGWAALSGLLLTRGLTGHCAVYQALGLSSWAA